ncbi:MAG: hypothetical protein ACRCXZ_01165 [Patescibacteria group bacterium]
MKKSIQYFLSLILLFTISFQGFVINGFDIIEYEQKVKIPHNFSFSYPTQMQKERDYYGNFIKPSYPTSVPIIRGEDYKISSEGDYQTISLENVFNIKYKVGPLNELKDKKPTVLCFNEFVFKTIGNNFYSIPLIEEIENETPSVNSNYKRLIHANAVFLNFNPNLPEYNYKFFSFKDNQLSKVEASQSANQSFKFCLESINGQFMNNSKESVDIVYQELGPDSEQLLEQIFRRSFFGNEQKADLNPLDENRRWLNVQEKSNTDQTKNQNNQKIKDFFFGMLQLLPFFALTLAGYLIFKRNMDKKNKN